MQNCNWNQVHKVSVALTFLLMSLSHALNQHSITRTKNFLSCARPTAAGILCLCGFPQPPQMRVPVRVNPPHTGLKYPLSQPHTFSAQLPFDETFAQPYILQL